MLEIKSVEWRNFMSYGDYDTILNIDGLGQCLITGDVLDGCKSDAETVIEVKKSNGAGKSTIPNVILWTLFGKTMHSANPGDKIVNHFTGKDCRCKINFVNGDYIIRTRKVGGKNELLFVKDGDETSLTSDTLSTLKNQQSMLNKEFNLDWELLCGSMFFNQYSKPWMEMADGTRKKAIERALHVDRFQYRAQVAKNKKDTIEKLIESLNLKKINLENHINRLSHSKESVESSLEEFEKGKDDRIKDAIQHAKMSKRQRDEIVRVDIDKLLVKWSLVEKIKAKIAILQTNVNSLSKEISELIGYTNSDKNKIKLWEQKSGKICGECEQDISVSHTEEKIKPYKDNLKKTEDSISAKEEEKLKVEEQITQIKDILLEKTPKISINEAKLLDDRWETYNKDIKRYLQIAENIKTETNPHGKSLSEIIEQIEAAKKEINTIEEEINQSDFLLKHYHYVYKAWSDRSKIKSLIFQDHLPFINDRLKHYLGVFGLDIHIELNTSLGIKSNLWGYEFESGGERKRTDVAFMLSMFDFHEQMYGRQSNVLVLDEVDGRLDDDGIDSLINIIKNDLANKVSSILIISHRNMMHDTFTKEIVVKREGTDDFRGFSRLEII